MFTGVTVKLSNYAGRFGLHVMRDCDFAFVGKVPTLLDKRIVPCGLPQHILAAKAEAGIVGIITTAEHVELVPDHIGLAIAENPVSASLSLHEAVCAIPDLQWVSFPTRIDASATIHPAAVIASTDVVIGANSSIGPGAYIRERTIIGDNCHIGDGVVVGLDALEIFEDANPRRILRQAGGVQIANGVTILSKCTVARATFGGFTRIGEGTIADVLIYIAHDVQIGKRVTLVACCAISGRCVLGDDSYIGPSACLRNGVEIGAGARVSMGAVVTKDVPAGATVSGNFAVDHSKWLAFIKGF